MLTNAQKNILINALTIRKNKGEDIVAFLKTCTNISDDDKTDILSHFSLTYELSLDEIKEKKIAELSVICREKIEYGVKISIDGVEEYFPYNLVDGDQGNIDGLFNMAKATGLSQPYHCKGGMCKLYTPEQLTQLYIAVLSNKAEQETYFNQLKYSILDTYKDNTDKDAVKAIVYGQPLTGVYLDNYNAIMEQNALTIQALIK